MRRLLTMLVVLLMAMPCWGTDDGTLRTTLLPVTTINVASEGTLTQAGTIYRWGASAATSYAANVRRTMSVLSASARGSTDGVGAENEAGAGTGWMTPFCGIPDVAIFGTSTGNSSKLYKSTNGTTWSEVSFSGMSGTINGMFTVQLASGAYRLISFTGTAGTTLKPYLSDDNGATWAAATTDAWLGTPFFNGLQQKPGTGIICAGTYSGVTTANRLMRSTDYGESWTSELEIGDSAISHIHAVGYHTGLNRWVFDTGDTDYGKRRTYYSDDDGDNWVSYALDGATPITSRSGQITAMVDYGDPNCLAVASDSFHRVGRWNLSDWTLGMLPRYPYMSGTTIVSWELERLGGVWYHSPQVVNAGADPVVVLVSDDLIDWVPYYRAAQSGDNATQMVACKYVGSIGGKLHYLSMHDGTVYKRLAITPAKVARRPGIELAPIRDNDLGSAVSLCADAAQWNTPVCKIGAGDDIWASETAGTFALDTSTQFLPAGLGTTGCLRLTKTVAQSTDFMKITVSTKTNPTLTGTYVGHVFLKGSAANVGVNLWKSGDSVEHRYGLRPDGEWTEIWTTAKTYAAATGQLSLTFYALPQTGTIDVHIGAAEIVAVPFTPGWSVGGTPTASDAYTLTQTLASDWTLMLTATIPANTTEVGQDAYICTIKGDANDFAELYWDHANTKWSLEATNAGAATGSPVQSAARHLHRGSIARFAIRYADGVMRLSISDGGGVEHCTGSVTKTTTLLSGADQTIAYAKNDGSAGMPMVLSDVAVYGCCLSNDDLETVMESGAWSRKTGGTTRMEWGGN